MTNSNKYICWQYLNRWSAYIVFKIFTYTSKRIVDTKEGMESQSCSYLNSVNYMINFIQETSKRYILTLEVNSPFYIKVTTLLGFWLVNFFNGTRSALGPLFVYRDLIFKVQIHYVKEENFTDRYEYLWPFYLPFIQPALI